MRKYALLKNNAVIAIQDISDDDYQCYLQNYQQLIDIEDQQPPPTIGWILEGNSLVPPEEALSAEIIMEKIKAARLFGVQLVSEMVDRIGAKNMIIGKTDVEILAVVSALSGIRMLLEGGALITARSTIVSIRPKFPYLIAEMDYAVDKITTFLRG